jgi:hypothetical protein
MGECNLLLRFNICRILYLFLYNDGDPGKRGFSNKLIMKMNYLFKNT